ncbi:DNA polymerase iota [Musca domestica]|uniref:DNA polymerase iota n=1 Tax=Musca domestica TaxID=7370 RepID=A0A1I8M628_MUSDO|nr:DNA polymerase iota [Musca domestica]XP_011293667.1 DNA polymerase iota [Musca domestica]XP_011293668.1 DNA polymerase iota [Musca domestica]XP_011293669.1 DNA polymerase iota [Musca domestica]
MDFASVLQKNEPHQRTIIHIDMDYFYAQVEEIRDPTLKSRPLGVQQKNIVVTCNYNARAKGIKKLMLVSEAKKLCPDLVLVVGEDLTPYRQMSQKIFEILLNYTPLVEKLGFDENFMDVSALVEKREQEKNQLESDDIDAPTVVGHIYPSDGTTLNACRCGCAYRLALGTQIAQEIREELSIKLGLTCCAGISYNKLLAKLVGSQYKPNQQTVLVSTHAEQFMRELCDLNRITGIGQKTECLLLESGVNNVEELQRCDIDFLKKKFGFETATKLKDLAFGRDNCAVRPTGKPKTIGLEDSCKPISVRTDVEERFRLLLLRLMEQVAEDGRIPICIKVVLRKFDLQKKSSHRETKQANILPSLFKSYSCADSGGPKVVLADGAQEKLLKIVMRLFERVVDLSKPFNITLIGLAFSKFQQRKVGSSSIANFLIKKTDLEVQSITSLTNTDVDAIGVTVDDTSHSTPNLPSSDNEGFRSSPTTFQPSDQFYRRRTTAASPIPMLVDNGSESGATNSDFSDFSETEVEPSPKKSRISRLLLNKRRCFGNSAAYNSPCESAADVASPSKLRVCDLRLNSRDSDRDFSMTSFTSASPNNTPTSPLSISTTATTQTLSVQTSNLTDSLEDFRANALVFSEQHSMSSSPSINSIPMDSCTSAEQSETNNNAKQYTTSITNQNTKNTGNLANIPCPAGVDPQVFNELPVDVQNELIASWRSSLAAAAAAVANGTLSSLGPSGAANASQKSNVVNNTAKAGGGGVNSTATQKNTLYRYFLRNK